MTGEPTPVRDNGPYLDLAPARAQFDAVAFGIPTPTTQALTAVSSMVLSEALLLAGVELSDFETADGTRWPASSTRTRSRSSPAGSFGLDWRPRRRGTRRDGGKGYGVAEILTSAEVREALGVDGMRQVQRASLTEGRCPFCQRGLPADGPVTVVMARSSTITHAAYAHPQCSASVVLDVPDELLAQSWPDAMDMGVTLALVPHGQALLPVIVAELPNSRAYRANGPAGRMGELTDLMVSGLLERGWALVSRLREAPRKVAGWTVAMRPGTAAAKLMMTITANDATVFYEGTAYPPPGWQAAVERYGWCVLYAASVAVGEATEYGASLRELRAASARGDLVGARVTVAWDAT